MKTGPWQWKHYPWLKEMHNADTDLCVGMKAAQMGFTETVLNITFYSIDIYRRDCLYVLPNKQPDASDFSASRFDAALEASPHLANLFSDVKNIGHKRAGTANLYVRGSQSRAGLKSIPVSLIVMDEIEEFNQDNIPLAMERVSGQFEHQIWLISTPKIEDSGIHLYYKKSDMRHFFFRCPGCQRYIELEWGESLSIDDPPILHCQYCSTPLPHENKSEWLSTGKWIPGNTEPDLPKGYHINQMYSPTITPQQFIDQAKRAESDPTEEQELYNSKLGIPHAVKGAKLSLEEVNSCCVSERDAAISGLTTMGIDVGTFFHYEIDEWRLSNTYESQDINDNATSIVRRIGKTRDVNDLYEIIRTNNITAVVIDANPERRLALELANHFPGRIRCCFYGRGINGKQINLHRDEPTLTVDRTSWLDLSLNRFRKRTIRLPRTTPQEYKDHLLALVRRYERDSDGNPIGRYVNGGKADHYAHARNYAEIALPLAMSLSQNYDISIAL